MLLTTFLPEVDELPTSWMARLAVANGYTDIDDMLQSLGITSGTRRVTRHVDYFKLIIAQLPKSDWVTTCVTLYMNELREQRKLIPVLNEEHHVYVCPECLKEDLEKNGGVVYHFQHQYPGTFTCWKHGCNLARVKEDALRKPVLEETDYTPVKGSYETDREKRMYGKCYSRASLYYRMVKYQLDTLLKDKNLDVDHVDEALIPGYDGEVPFLAANILWKSTVEYLTGDQKEKVLSAIFRDPARYQRFFNNISYDTMVGFEMKKVPNGHTIVHIKNENKYKARRQRRKIKNVRRKIKKRAKNKKW